VGSIMDIVYDSMRQHANGALKHSQRGLKVIKLGRACLI